MCTFLYKTNQQSYSATSTKHLVAQTSRHFNRNVIDTVPIKESMRPDNNVFVVKRHPSQL